MLQSLAHDVMIRKSRKLLSENAAMQIMKIVNLRRELDGTYDSGANVVLLQNMTQCSKHSVCVTTCPEPFRYELVELLSKAHEKLHIIHADSTELRHIRHIKKRNEHVLQKRRSHLCIPLCVTFARHL